jgi:hypothetical protein
MSSGTSDNSVVPVEEINVEDVTLNDVSDAIRAAEGTLPSREEVVANLSKAADEAVHKVELPEIDLAAIRGDKRYLPLEEQTLDISDDDPWSAVEPILEKIMHSSLKFHLAYKREYIASSGVRAHYGVFIILGSGVNSIFIAGGNNFISPYVITIMTCLLSLLTGLVQSLRTFFKVDEKVDNCLITSKDLFKLYCDIQFMLGQPSPSRKVDADKFQTDVTSHYLQIMDNAVTLPNGKDNPIYEQEFIENLRSRTSPRSP